MNFRLLFIMTIKTPKSIHTFGNKKPKKIVLDLFKKIDKMKGIFGLSVGLKVWSFF